MGYALRAALKQEVERVVRGGGQRDEELLQKALRSLPAAPVAAAGPRRGGFDWYPGHWLPLALLCVGLVSALLTLAIT